MVLEQANEQPTTGAIRPLLVGNKDVGTPDSPVAGFRGSEQNDLEAMAKRRAEIGAIATQLRQATGGDESGISDHVFNTLAKIIYTTRPMLDNVPTDVRINASYITELSWLIKREDKTRTLESGEARD